MDVKRSVYDFPPSQNKCHKHDMYLLCTAVGEVVSVTYLLETVILEITFIHNSKKRRR